MNRTAALLLSLLFVSSACTPFTTEEAGGFGCATVLLGPDGRCPSERDSRFSPLPEEIPGATGKRYDEGRISGPKFWRK